jgi:hypothetical protein
MKRRDPFVVIAAAREPGLRLSVAPISPPSAAPP